jgi:hypothetical protein
MQLLLEMSDRLEFSIKNDGLRHTMQTQDASNIQFSVLLSSVVHVQWNEISRLGEPINDHPYGIKLVGREADLQ